MLDIELSQQVFSQGALFQNFRSACGLVFLLNLRLISTGKHTRFMPESKRSNSSPVAKLICSMRDNSKSFGGRPLFVASSLIYLFGLRSNFPLFSSLLNQNASNYYSMFKESWPYSYLTLLASLFFSYLRYPLSWVRSPAGEYLN